MILTIIISAITFITMILGILFFPKIKIKKFCIDSYWVITLIGLFVLLIFKTCDIKTIYQGLTENNAINPIKILVLFLSMTIISIFLDEVGFFKYVADVTLKKAKTSQVKLFIYLYITVSVLTVFTSNDIIILSFTPFICYFAKNAKINPIPYLACEFVGANTWSMALVIGNPTNIYISTAYGINFVSYFLVMIIPTVCSGIVSFICLYLLFRKDLKTKIENVTTSENSASLIGDKFNLTVGIITLIICTLLLAVLSYFNVEMWLISLFSFLFLFVFILISSIFRKRKPTELLYSLKRTPYPLIPFVLSMFSIILILNQNGVTDAISSILIGKGETFKFGIGSFLASNLINNIPMSVLFCSLLNNSTSLSSVFATIIGSNLGALFTPIGALAGIMWTNILSSHNLKYGYLDFLKTGVIVGIPSLITALSVLTIAINFI